MDLQDGVQAEELIIAVEAVFVYTKTVLIVWDEPKRLANLYKHGFDFQDLDEAFFVQSVVIPARGGRRKAIGSFSGKIIAVVFSYLGTEALSVISMRVADRGERSLLE